MKKLLFTAFLLYWFFAFLNGFNNNVVSKIIPQKITNYIFPPQYKMFIGPYKTLMSVNYTFYNDLNLPVTINSNQFFSEEIHKELPISNSSARISIQFQNNLILLNELYTEEYKKLIKTKKVNKAFFQNLSIIILNRKDGKEKIEFATVFYKYILKKRKDLANCKLVKIQIHRHPILLPYKFPIKYKEEDLTYKIGNKILYDKTIFIK